MKGVYIVGGYPDLATYIEVLKILKESKIDFVEIGLPFNDPIADGPVISKAIKETLKKGYNINEILTPARDILINKKLFVMTYSNLIYNYPFKKFKNFNGLIIADCPNTLHDFFYKRGCNIPIIPFATPATRKKDLPLLKKSKGNYVYFIGIKGTTGGKIDLKKNYSIIINKIKKITNKKIIWGFGIKNKYHIKKISNFVDGIIVGTEIVKRQNNVKDFKNFLKYIES